MNCIHTYTTLKVKWFNLATLLSEHGLICSCAAQTVKTLKLVQLACSLERRLSASSTEGIGTQLEMSRYCNWVIFSAMRCKLAGVTPLHSDILRMCRFVNELTSDSIPTSPTR